MLRHTATEASSLRIGGVRLLSPVRSHRLPCSTSLPALSSPAGRRLEQPTSEVSSRSRLPRETWPSLSQASPTHSSAELLSTGTPRFQARAPELLLPGDSPSNDALRVRNNGKPLQPRGSFRCVGGLRDSQSPAVSSRSVPVVERPGQIKLCGVKPVGIHFPDFTPLSTAQPPTKSLKETWSQVEQPRLTLRRREESWNDLPPPESEELAKLQSSLSADGHTTDALKKSAKKMDGMRILRRLTADTEKKRSILSERSTTQSIGDESVEQLALVVEEEDPLMQKMLKELNDTEASLRERVAEIEETQKVVDQCGGNRHATQVMTSRTVAVMKRKADLLNDVETRFSEYEAAHQSHEEILSRMKAGNLEAPPALCGVRKFISQYTHKPGEPVDADKSDFNAFAASFLLPSKHGALERFRAKAEEVSDWWAKICASIASDGGEKEIIKALIALAISAGAEKDHPFILRAEVILKDRVADRVLKEAKEAQDKDQTLAARAEQMGQVPAVGMAEKAADTITLSVRNAIQQEGVAESDQRIADAKAIAKALREADGLRRRMANRERNLAKQAAAKSEQKA